LTAPRPDPPLDVCGCCQTPSSDPTAIWNRPGLPELSYRIGTHSSFLRRLLAWLPLQPIADGPTLAALTTRAPADFTIGLLDAFATTADVLTFYEERIANEGYLRTATERRSVLELARTIGYELRPGVAATAYLSFTVEDAKEPAAGAEPSQQPKDAKQARTAVVPQGTQVLSIPGQNVLPQTFETSVELDARAEWNQLRPRLTQPQVVGIESVSGKQQLYLVGPDGQPLLSDPSTRGLKRLYFDGLDTRLVPADRLLVAAKGATGTVVWLDQVVKSVSLEADLNRTAVDFGDSPPPAPPAPPAQTLGALAYFRPERLLLTRTEVDTLIVAQPWRETALQALLSTQRWSAEAVLRTIATPPPPQPLPPSEGVFAFRSRVGFFGNTAPQHAAVPKATNLVGDPFAIDWDNDPTGPWQIWDDYVKTTSAANRTKYSGGADVFFERKVDGLVEGGWLLFDDAGTKQAYRVDAVVERSLSAFAISAKTTGVRLVNPEPSTPGPDKSTAFTMRGTTAYAASERLSLADLPIEDAVAAGSTSITLDRMVLGLSAGQPVALSGERDDLPGVVANEIVFVSDVVHSGGLTTVALREGLEYGYVRKTLLLNGNVVAATHGETVDEVLGSGDAAQPNQRFVLRKPPLTYVPATNPGGAASTLSVRVNGVRWDESASLYGLDPHSGNYSVRIGDDGKVTLTFGDGVSGSRLPSGAENVTAVYRSGIGKQGLVGPNTLTLLPKRPLGIRSVTNLVAADGADDPEDRDAARLNAPLVVLTMERIVSLQDYEDFAGGFAGVGKALAVAFWRHGKPLVHLTIASAAGDEASSDLRGNLADAIAQANDPGQEYLVDTFDLLYFDVTASIVVDDRYRFEDVSSAAVTAVRAAFAFDRRAFGEPVTSSDLIATLQAVDGVVATRLQALYIVQSSGGAPAGPPPASLTAARPQLDPATGLVTRAQLLLVNPGGIDIEELAGP
jgi:hypothetical protein